MIDKEHDNGRPINPPDWKKIPTVDPETGEYSNTERKMAKTWGFKTNVPPKELTPAERTAIELGEKIGIPGYPIHPPANADAKLSPLMQRLNKMRENIDSNPKHPFETINK